MPIDMRAAGIAALITTSLALTSAVAGPDPTGVWMNDTGRGAIEIKDCGGRLCGHVVWVKDASDTKGCGRQIIGEAAPVTGGLWDGGWIYSPEKKKRYDVELKPLADGTLRVKGYAGSKFFSKIMIWTKAPADLARCGGNQIAAATAAPVAPQGVVPSAPSASPAARPPAAPNVVAPPPVTPPAQVQEADTPEDNGTDEKLAIDDMNLGDLKLEKYFSRTASGNCKLDLPWVKLKFRCED